MRTLYLYVISCLKYPLYRSHLLYMCWPAASSTNSSSVSRSSSQQQSFSPNTIHEKNTVIRTLSLSTGTTTLAGPSCSAL